jgi:PHD/YefM family antitoxin component YafN of YafNO toxin-antitoxin module
MAIPKIKTATALRSDLYDTLKEVSEGRTQIITHQQGDPVLLVSKASFDEMSDQIQSLKKMAIGLSQIEEGKGVSNKNAIKKLSQLKRKWK